MVRSVLQSVVTRLGRPGVCDEQEHAALCSRCHTIEKTLVLSCLKGLIPSLRVLRISWRRPRILSLPVSWTDLGHDLAAYIWKVVLWPPPPLIWSWLAVSVTHFCGVRNCCLSAALVDVTLSHGRARRLGTFPLVFSMVAFPGIPPTPRLLP